MRFPDRTRNLNHEGQSGDTSEEQSCHSGTWNNRGWNSSLPVAPFPEKTLEKCAREAHASTTCACACLLPLSISWPYHSLLSASLNRELSMIALSINVSMIDFVGARNDEGLVWVSDCYACLCACRQRVRLCTCAVINVFLCVRMSALSCVTMSLCLFTAVDECVYAGINCVHMRVCVRVPSGGTEPVLSKLGETCGFA